jgi:hypothetical protein
MNRRIFLYAGLVLGYVISTMPTHGATPGPMDLWYRQVFSDKTVGGSEDVYWYWFFALAWNPDDCIEKARRHDTSSCQRPGLLMSALENVGYRYFDRNAPDQQTWGPDHTKPPPGQLTGKKLATITWSQRRYQLAVYDDVSHNMIGKFTISLDKDDKVLFPDPAGFGFGTSWDGRCKFHFRNMGDRTWMWFSLEPHRETGGPTVPLC